APELSTAAAATAPAAAVAAKPRPTPTRLGRRRWPPGRPPMTCWSCRRPRLTVSLDGAGLARMVASISISSVSFTERPLIDCLAEPSAGAAEPRADGARRDSEGLRDLLVAELAQRHEHHHIALALGQGGQRPQQPRLHLLGSHHRHNPVLGPLDSGPAGCARQRPVVAGPPPPPPPAPGGGGAAHPQRPPPPPPLRTRCRPPP